MMIIHSMTRDMDEDYLSWIKTLNQAYKNGCISDDSFTDDNTAWQEKESWKNTHVL